METKCPYTCKDISPFIIPPSFLEVVNVAMEHKLQIHIRLRFRDKWALLGENGATFFFRKNIFHEFHLTKRIGFSLMLKFIVLCAVFPLLLQRE